MLIKEMIAELQEIQKEHGNLEVLTWRDKLTGFIPADIGVRRITSKTDLEFIRDDLNCMQDVNLKVGDYYVEV